MIANIIIVNTSPKLYIGVHIHNYANAILFPIKINTYVLDMHI